MALAERIELTDAERHEVMSVWSKSDIVNVDSPAMRKLLGESRPAHDFETIPARRHTRRKFDTPTKKPGQTRPFFEASNDATYAHLYIDPWQAFQRTLFEAS